MARLSSASSASNHTFAFIFPMASGHINPSLPVARALVELGHRVHYLCREQMREAIENTGACFHEDIQWQTELYDGHREVDVLGCSQHLQKELGVDKAGGAVAGMLKVLPVQLEMLIPGTLRWLKEIRADAIVNCPLINIEATYSAKIMELPCIGIFTTAGFGSGEKALTEFLSADGQTLDAVREGVERYQPAYDVANRLKAKYGIDVDPVFHLNPPGRNDTVVESSLTLVTTCDSLLDPVSPELAKFYEDAAVAVVAVGPLLDKTGAVPCGAHKPHEEKAGGADESASEIVSAVKAAKAAGRQVILLSMGTVVTGDHGDAGWNGRIPQDGQPHGLSGKELCQSAWAGAFDAFGRIDPEEGPLLILSTGPQPDALEGLDVPGNLISSPVIPQVYILNAGVDLFLTHGGQNSFMEALASAVPVVVCPGFGDQIANGKKACDFGVGLMVERPRPELPDVRAACEQYRERCRTALLHVQSSPSFREAANSFSQELQAAGGVPRAVKLILQICEDACKDTTGEAFEASRAGA